MTWLDMKKEIVKWGAECIRIPYQITVLKKGDLSIESHSYYPDFYYELKIGDNIRKVVVEVKPKKEYEDAILFESGKFEVSNNLNNKKLKNLEYRFKTAQKNSEKWKTMINWCNLKGYEFIIITEDHLRKFNV